MENWLREQIENCHQLPTFPEAVVTVINLSKRPKVTIDQVVSSIEVDGNLSRQVVSVANSAFYGFSRQIGTLTEAVTLLGTRPTLTISLSFLLSEALCGSEPANSKIDYPLHWKRSIVSAVAARELGKSLKCRELEQLFLASLLQDIGVLVLDIALGQKYSKAIYKMQQYHLHLTAVEKRLLSVDHSVVGAYMLDYWHFPDSIISAVKQSHLCYPVEFDSTFARIVAASGHLADYLIWENGDGYPSRLFLEAILEGLYKLNPGGLDSVFQRTVDQLPSIAVLFKDKELMNLSNEQKETLLRKASELYAQHMGCLPQGLKI